MGFVYAAMWLLVGLILIFKMGRENKVFYVAGAFFLVLGAWWLADVLSPRDLFAGTGGILLRVLIGIVLVIVSIAFYREKKKAPDDVPPDDAGKRD